MPLLARIICHITLCYLVTKATETGERHKRTVVGSYPTCPRGCTSCSKANGCVTCEKGLYILLVRSGMKQRGTCTHFCPTGYYGVRRYGYNKCNNCHIANCATCFNNHFCTRCIWPHVAFAGKCVDKCPPGLYYAKYNHLCTTKVNCAVSPWSTWGQCSRNGQSCGHKHGLQTRTRKLLQKPSSNGSRCPALTENRRCRMLMRYCVDLVNNKSDLTIQEAISPAIWRKWNKKWRRARRRRKKKRRKHRRKHRMNRLHKNMSTKNDTI